MQRIVSLGRFIHSSAKNMVRVVPVEALEDNYMYVVIDEKSNKAAVVDPADFQGVQRTVESLGVHLECALVTHHHWDHSGGTKSLSDTYGDNFKIYGGDDRIARLTDKVTDNQTFQVGDLNILCLHTPCHTKGHICYYVTDASGKKIVFTGDTLFIAGCGRFFEGTAEEMDHSLNEKLANLPNETEVYCGHEYTVDDLLFAKNVEPSNQAVKQKLEWAQSQRSQNKPTVPSTIEDEKRTNPFMRVRESKELQDLAKSTNPVDVMAFIRQKKNNFRP